MFEAKSFMHINQYTKEDIITSEKKTSHVDSTNMHLRDTRTKGAGSLFFFIC